MDALDLQPVEAPSDTGPLDLQPVEPKKSVPEAPQFDKKPIENHFRAFLDNAFAGEKASPAGPRTAESISEAASKIVEEPLKLSNYQDTWNAIWDSIIAGGQSSVAGLLKRHATPDVVLGKDPDMFMKIASGLTQVVGDLPTLIAGAAPGSAELNPPLAAAGALGFTQGAKRMLMDSYSKGEVTSFRDFWSRASAVAIDSAKGFVTGGLGAGAGLATGGVLASAGAGTAITVGGSTLSEVAAMTMVGAGLEGRIPEPQEFVDGALLMVGAGIGLHGAQKLLPGTKVPTISDAEVDRVRENLQDAYVKTGVKPAETALEAERNVVLKTELLSEKPNMDAVHEQLGGPKAPDKEESFFAPESERGSFSTKSTEPPKPEYSEAGKDILSQMAEKETAARKKLSFDEFYEKRVDKYDPTLRMQEELKSIDLNKQDLPPDKNGYILSRLSNDAPAKTLYMLKKATMNFSDLSDKGPSFDSVIKGADTTELNFIMASKRALEQEYLNSQRIKEDEPIIEHPFSEKMESARDVVANAPRDQLLRAQGITDWRNDITDYATDGGLLTKELNKSFKEMNGAYIDWKAIFSPEELLEKPGVGKGKAGSLKERIGSARKIQNPLTAAVESADSLITLTEINRAKLAIVDYALSIEGQELVKKVPPRIEVTKADVKEMQKYLDDNGINGDAKELELFRRQAQDAYGPNQGGLMREGKYEAYEFSDPAYARAFKALDGDVTSLRTDFRLLQAVTKLQKKAFTITPDFAIRHLERAFLAANVLSGKENISFKEVWNSLGDIKNETDDYYRAMKSGGFGGAFIDVNKQYVGKYIDSLNEQTGALDNTYNLAKSGVQKLEGMVHMFDLAVRLAKFKQSSEGASSGPKLIQGGFDMREITQDYQRIGAKMSAWNSIDAFQNVHIQSLDRYIRAWKEDPTTSSKNALMYVTGPTVLLWWANHKNERMNEDEQWQKDMFWRINLPFSLVGGKDLTFRIPVPPIVGTVFKVLPERALDHFFGQNPNALKDFDRLMTEMVVPPIIPDGIRPVWQQYNNKADFTKRPVVPMTANPVLPKDQWSNYTSEFAKVLGKLIAPIGDHIGTREAKLSSPAVLDNYFSAWGGATGKLFLNVLDEVLVKSGVAKDRGPSFSIYDIPFVRSFLVREPSMNASSIEAFRDRYDEASMTLNSIKFEARKGDLQGAQELLATAPMKLRDIHSTISNSTAAIQKIYDAPETVIKKADKQKLIDTVIYRAIQAAQQGNKILDSLDGMKKAK